jgi:serine/threonine protein kinase
VSGTTELYATTQHEHVVKILSGDDVSDEPCREIALQQSLDCENLCKLTEAALDEDKSLFYLVMQYFNGGELYSRVEKFGSLPEDHCRTHMRDILRGVQHMHENKIAHRDLSLENIMIESGDSHETSHIIDFGLAREVEGESNTVTVKRAAGKLAYMSPEIYENTGNFDCFKADVWACGVMLFVMLVGMQPYTKASTSDVNFAVLISKGPSALLDSWGLGSEVSSGARALLDSMLAAAPASRPTAASILERDDWLLKNCVGK